MKERIQGNNNIIHAFFWSNIVAIIPFTLWDYEIFFEIWPLIELRSDNELIRYMN